MSKPAAGFASSSFVAPGTCFSRGSSEDELQESQARHKGLLPRLQRRFSLISSSMLCNGRSPCRVFSIVSPGLTLPEICCGQRANGQSLRLLFQEMLQEKAQGPVCRKSSSSSRGRSMVYASANLSPSSTLDPRNPRPEPRPSRNVESECEPRNAHRCNLPARGMTRSYRSA